MSGQAGIEAPAVTITRLVCVLVLTLVILCGGVALILTHPEYTSHAALVIGLVIGAWFSNAGVRDPRRRRVE
jgi:hypothetical protein